METRLQEGKFFLETYWFRVAEQVIDLAIEVYGLDTEQGNALRKVFLRPNDFVVELTN
jgi:hypothetical protein